MDIPEELLKWTENLSVPEKRFIKLQGKARSGTDSQLLMLFDWLNKTGEKEKLPAKASFSRNLPTLAARLKALMLDSLYLLHKESTVSLQLNSAYSEILLLQSKSLMSVAARQQKKARKLAAAYSRYSFLLLLTENEIMLAQSLPVEQFAGRLAELRSEEQLIHKNLQYLRNLWHTHNELLVLARMYPFSLDTEVVKQVRTLAETEEVQNAFQSSSFLEYALAVSILGIRDMFIRDPDSSVPRYQKLIRRWQALPDWQIDQPQLLLTVCKYYQNACIFSPVDHEKISADLTFLSGFSGLPRKDLVNLQDLLYSNQFAIALNTGRFDVALPMIAEIENWLSVHAGELTENQVYPYRCNFIVAEFLSGNYAAANRQVNNLLNVHNRKARIDIYEFALLIRPILQFESGDDLHNEYLIRSGKRHFQKNKSAADFELMVMKFLTLLHEQALAADRRKAFHNFLQELERFADSLPPTIPLLGLNEISMWAESNATGTPIRDVFLRRVEENLRMLEGVKKIG